MNVVASTTSVWKGGLTRLVTRGVALDVKLGIRMLGKQPLLTGVAMLALGLGIPAALSLHHALGVFLSPLPVPEGERVMGIRNWNLETRRPVPASVHELAAWRETLTSFQSIGAVRSYMVTCTWGILAPRRYAARR